MQRKALGKGLDALIEENVGEREEKSWVTTLPIDKINASSLQPRKKFSDEELDELKSSIKDNGILQPILVRQVKDKFELIAGERRFRAAKAVGITNIPAIVKQVSDEELLELSLIENIQRSNLTPVEEAFAYKKLQDDFDFSQAEIADKVSKDRTTITNHLRLLTLPKSVLDKLDSNEISFGHAKAILGLSDKDKQIKLCDEIISKMLSVRETEKLVSKILVGKETTVRKKKHASPEIVNIQEQLSKKLGTKVHIMAGRKKGKINIEYYSNKDLERIISILL